MKSVFRRIGKRIKMTAREFRCDCCFSLRYALLRVVANIGGRIGLRSVAKKAAAAREAWIRSYLEKSLDAVIAAHKDNFEMGTASEKAPLWLCWWTGEDDAPELVKKCIESIRAQAGDHPVCFIDRNNYGDYIDIPEYMMNNVKAGKMGLAHLADYIRVSVLAKYGGLWLDATIFCASRIPEEYFVSPFFTCRSEERECGYVSRLRWVTFVLGGRRGNVFYDYMKDAFEVYWEKNERAVDYLFFDYIIDIGYRNIPAIKELIESTPPNNLRRDDLQAAFNAFASADSFDDVVKDDTVLYKLSWRETYAKETHDRKKSLYGAFLERPYK